MKDLIKTYQQKIEGYSTDIRLIIESIALMKQGETPKIYFDDIEEASKKRSKLDALRQQLFQVTKDLEDYL